MKKTVVNLLILYIKLGSGNPILVPVDYIKNFIPNVGFVETILGSFFQKH